MTQPEPGDRYIELRLGEDGLVEIRLDKSWRKLTPYDENWLGDLGPWLGGRGPAPLSTPKPPALTEPSMDPGRRGTPLTLRTREQ
jgi:hypothetical protein